MCDMFITDAHQTVTMSHVNLIIVTLVDVHHVNKPVVSLASHVGIAVWCRVTVLSGDANRYLTSHDALWLH